MLFQALEHLIIWNGGICLVPRGSAIHFHYIVLVLLLGWRKGGGKHHLGHRRAGPTASAFAAGGVTSGSWLALLLDEDLGVTAG